MNTNSSDPTKPCKTRDGRKVKILTTKANGRCPILGNVEGIKCYKSWTIEGRAFISAESKTDLINYKPEPWTLSEPPHGYEWLRTDGWTKDMISDGWTKDMISDGWRPYLKGEEKVEKDRYQHKHSMRFETVILDVPIDPDLWYITQRPLPAPKPRIVKVPLEPSDITPGSVIRTRE